MEPFFGLPKEVVFCKRCVISNQRPNSTVEFKHSTNRQGTKYTGFDNHGICDACKVADEKDFIDWCHREEELLQLLEKYRGKTKPYDCVIPGSGGKDSFFTSHILKEKYGMSPLPVSYTHLTLPTILLV